MCKLEIYNVYKFCNVNVCVGEYNSLYVGPSADILQYIKSQDFKVFIIKSALETLTSNVNT